MFPGRHKTIVRSLSRKPAPHQAGKADLHPNALIPLNNPWASGLRQGRVGLRRSWTGDFGTTNVR